ncbi:MAG TPA: cob(I)yrinic acid a,c-diamide adenosyltransferase [Anaerolineales bacterium]|nr:cob(I)yrinic acid a,c-diamide adenosyltransferase [Anaerolineales bacterium]
MTKDRFQGKPRRYNVRMPGFFTGGGDDGFTGVLGEGRVPKHDHRIEAVGALDEAAAVLGLARSLTESSDVRATLENLQRHLYQVMAEVSAPGQNAARFRTIGADQVEWLEETIERFSPEAELPNGFLLGGDSPAGGALDLARTVVRRAERGLAALVHDGQVENVSLLSYLNRASSLCFVLILVEYHRAGISPTMAKL